MVETPVKVVGCHVPPVVRDGDMVSAAVRVFTDEHRDECPFTQWVFLLEWNGLDGKASAVDALKTVVIPDGMSIEPRQWQMPVLIELASQNAFRPLEDIPTMDDLRVAIGRYFADSLEWADVP